jgi:release factor glutamine methyltransferase
VASIHEHVAEARHQLRGAGLSIAEADLSARVIAEHLLGWSPEKYLADGSQPEPTDFAERFHAAVSRRAARQPLAYIVGEREFWGLALEVTPDVLIPRPETEIIVEAALELHPDPDAPIVVADVCTGSGCLAIAIAHERPHAVVTASDISEAALAVARRNAARHAVADRVRFVRADLLETIAGPFDLIVANPPYVRSGDRDGLQPEVREEPAVALYGGSEGLDAIARLVAQAPSRLRRGGHLIFEFGLGQDDAIEQLVASSRSLQLLGLRRDLQGIARTAVTQHV